MRVGDLVRPINGQVLRTGSGIYTQAVIVSLEPFVLVSQDADMKWQATIKKENFETTGKIMTADDGLELCLDRLSE